jgi:hypothetical protein
MSVISPKIKPELAAEQATLAQQGGDVWGPERLLPGAIGAASRSRPLTRCRTASSIEA